MEAPYHALTGGGHIFYVEIDGDAYQTFGQTDKPYAERALVYHRFNSIFRSKHRASRPQFRHQQGELKFTAKDRKTFGEIPGVTDKIYYTNSNHVPVYYHCSPRHKAEVEAPYHALTGGGHIFYVAGPSTDVPSTMRTTLSGLFMHYAVVKFGKLGLVPAVGSAYKVAGDTLQTVDMLCATTISRLLSVAATLCTVRTQYFRWRARS